jgi:hypothetical protein
VKHGKAQELVIVKDYNQQALLTQLTMGTECLIDIQVVRENGSGQK